MACFASACSDSSCLLHRCFALASDFCCFLVFMLLLLFLLLLLACLVSLVLEGSFFQALPSCCFQPLGSLRLFLLLRRKPVLVFAACLWLLRNFLLPLATCGCCPFHSVFCCSLAFMLLLLFLTSLCSLSLAVLGFVFATSWCQCFCCCCACLLVFCWSCLLCFVICSHSTLLKESIVWHLLLRNFLLQLLSDVSYIHSLYSCSCYFLVTTLLLFLLVTSLL